MRGLKKAVSLLLTLSMMLSVVAGLAAVSASAETGDVTVTKTAAPVSGQLNTWEITVTIKGEVASENDSLKLNGTYTDTFAEGFDLKGAPSPSTGTALETVPIIWTITDLKYKGLESGKHYASETLKYTIIANESIVSRVGTATKEVPITASAVFNYTLGSNTISEPTITVTDLPSVKPVLIDVTKNIPAGDSVPTIDSRVFQIKVSDPAKKPYIVNLKKSEHKIIVPIGPEGMYEVVETAISGTPAELTQLEDYITTCKINEIATTSFILHHNSDWAKVEVTNDNNEKGSITIKKTITYDTRIDHVYQFTIRNKDTSAIVKTVLLRPNESKMEELPYGTYIVEEINVPEGNYVIAPAMNPITVTLNADKDDIVLGFVNSDRPTPITTAPINVQKLWENGGPEDKKAIMIQLYRRSAAERESAFGSAVQVVNEEVFKLGDFPVTDPQGNAYIYYVDELTVPEGYRKSFSDPIDFGQIIYGDSDPKVIQPKELWLDQIEVLKIYNRHNGVDPDNPIFPLNLSGTHIKFIVGYPDGTVKPEGALTRAEGATMIAKLLADELAESIPNAASTGFTDSAKEWYTDYVAYIKTKNIISGYPDGSFQPNAPITRAEVSSMVAKLMTKTRIPTPFSDVAEHWALAAIEEVYGASVIDGDAKSTLFRPNDNIKRAEVASILNKVFNRSVDEEGLGVLKSKINTFPDLLTTYWGYYIMVEATNGHTYEREEGTIAETWKTLID